MCQDDCATKHEAKGWQVHEKVHKKLSKTSSRSGDGTVAPETVKLPLDYNLNYLKIYK